MKIFITAHSSRRGGGVVVAQALLRAFACVAPENEYIVTIPPNLGYEDICAKIPRCRTYVYKTRGFLRSLFWGCFGVWSIVKRERPDMLFNLGNWSWFPTHCFQATYIQSSYLCYPRSHWGKRSWLSSFSILMQVWARRLLLSLFADRLYCQTPVMKKRLQRIFPKKEILVLPPGINDTANKDAKSERIVDFSKEARNQFRLFYPVLTYPHKNFELLFDTFSKYRSELCGVVLWLTISPNADAGVGGARKFIEAHGLSKQIILLGELPKSQVDLLYKEVDVVVFPSLLETVGLPLVEAMRAGVPILASDMDFSRGICGDAALYFDPHSPESLRDKILEVWESQPLQISLSRNGRKISVESIESWDAIAKKFFTQIFEKSDNSAIC